MPDGQAAIRRRQYCHAAKARTPVPINNSVDVMGVVGGGGGGGGPVVPLVIASPSSLTPLLPKLTIAPVAVFTVTNWLGGEESSAQANA